MGQASGANPVAGRNIIHRELPPQLYFRAKRDGMLPVVDKTLPTVA